MQISPKYGPSGPQPICYRRVLSTIFNAPVFAQITEPSRAEPGAEIIVARAEPLRIVARPVCCHVTRGEKEYSPGIYPPHLTPWFHAAKPGFPWCKVWNGRDAWLSMEKKPEKGWESKSHEKANHMGLSSLAITDFSNCVPSFYNCPSLSLSLSYLFLSWVWVWAKGERIKEMKRQRKMLCV